MKQSRYPTGWDERRVRRVLEHYESQSEDEAIAEDEAAFKLRDQTVMVVPKKLVPEIMRLKNDSVGPAVCQDLDCTAAG